MKNIVHYKTLSTYKSPSMDILYFPTVFPQKLYFTFLK